MTVLYNSDMLILNHKCFRFANIFVRAYSADLPCTFIFNLLHLFNYNIYLSALRSATFWGA